MLFQALLFGLALTGSPQAAPGLEAPSVCAPVPDTAFRREAWRFESRGREISGILYRPTGPARDAGVVMLPGAGGVRNGIEAYDDVAVRLAARGYHVLLASYYDASRGGIDRQGRNMALWRDAGRDGVASLSGQLPEGAAMGLWGFSLGGFLAIDSGLRDADVEAVVAVAAGTDVATPNRAHRRAPVLLLFADRDPVVSPGSTRALADHLRRSGVTTEMQALPTRRHFFEAEIWCDVARRSADHFDSQLTRAAD